MTWTRIEPVGRTQTVTWEEQYQSALREQATISTDGVAEIIRCTNAAFDFIGRSVDGNSTSIISGVVVGAIQSGKTGLMINLAARALDNGFRCVVVLAGLRDDLRTQTALRFQRDLLQRGDPIPERQGGGFTHPKGVGYHGERQECWSPAAFDDVNHDEAFTYLFSSRLRRGDSVLAVAKKNIATLNHLRSAYEFAINQTADHNLPLLVIDDECDEASVTAGNDAPTPERITEVWRGLSQQVAYVGFTATPAANLLQEPSSGLFPNDFVLTLRTPGDTNTRLTYLEPDPDRRYTGGHAFYQLLDSRQRINFMVRAEMSSQEFHGTPGEDNELEEALVAYLVSGAIRLIEQGVQRFDNSSQLPAPHTMLAHTESSIASHWRLCERIVRIVRGKGGRSKEIRENIARVRPQDRLSSEDLSRWLDAEPYRWEYWFDEYRKSRSVLLEVSPDRKRVGFPTWEKGKRLDGDVVDREVEVRA